MDLPEIQAETRSRETQARRFQTFARKLLLNQWVSSHLETHVRIVTRQLYFVKKSRGSN